MNDLMSGPEGYDNTKTLHVILFFLMCSVPNVDPFQNEMCDQVDIFLSKHFYLL